MFNILTLNKIAKCGLDRLDKNVFTVTEDTENADGIILRSFSMHDMEFPKGLRAVARAGAGTNNIPIPKCSEQGIAVFNTPGANANAVKELVIAGLLLSSRKINQGIAWANTLSGDDVAKQVEKGKSSFAGCEIKGKTLGIIGLGAIGVLVANAAIKLGMEVIGYDPYLSINSAWNLDHKVMKAASNDEVFEKADYVSVHVPLMDSTRYLINKDAISKMKDGVKVLNFARGELVNNADIKEALASGKVSCYVVDFPNAEVLNVEGVIPIPHLGASTEESEDNCAVMAADEIAEYLTTGNVVNSVNFPACSLAGGAKGRIAIVHKNVPNMITQFTATLSKDSINISDMINKSRDDIGYTIINTDTEINSGVVADMQAIDGVLRVTQF